MFAITATSLHADDPLKGLTLGERPDPTPKEGWVVIDVKAASLNHHDIFTLRGVGMDAKRLPMVIGCDAAGVTADGRAVVVHSIISSPDAEAEFGSELYDPKMSMFSEQYDGTFATKLAVPERNLIDKPASLSFEEASCLGVAYLTAYRALFTQAGLKAGQTVLVQGAGGGVSTAAVLLGKAAGLQVWVTSRSENNRARAKTLGADQVFETNARLPQRVDAVLESVGEATWSHSLKALKPGGIVVTVGSTSGPNPPSDLQRVFIRQLRIQGSMMGTKKELVALIDMLARTKVKPLIDRTLPLERGREAFEQMIKGDLFGKIVLTAS
jgi:NADPH:quinone reductase-like Zn-dependent oxidoreductase